MFSDLIQAALEREVVGQGRAVQSVVRGVTRVLSGLTPHEHSLCAYLFLGPTGTGKTHLVRCLARFLHGDEQRTVVVDCAHCMPGDPSWAFLSQLMPLFLQGGPAGARRVLEPPPLSILRVENLERGPQEIARALAASLETGEILLPQGRRGSLRNCLIFFTTALCSREILAEDPRIGFTGSPEGDEGPEDRIARLCIEQATGAFGAELVGRLDYVVPFRPIQQEQLPELLERRLDRLDQWLRSKGFGCEMAPSARRFLVGQGQRDLRLGAHDLVRAHRRFVEFPVADLLVSGRIPPGGRVLIERLDEQDHLHFTVEGLVAATRPSMQRVAVA